MEETSGATAYGVSLAGGGFDFYKFVRQPQTIVRLLSWVSVQEFISFKGSEEAENETTWSVSRCVWPGAPDLLRGPCGAVR